MDLTKPTKMKSENFLTPFVPTLVIDFDGTIVHNEFPEIGPLVHLAVETIQMFNLLGFNILISTCRTGSQEGEAKRFLDKHDIPYHYINNNMPEHIEQYSSDPRKLYGDVYIDDRGIFFKLDWEKIYITVCKKFLGFVPDLIV